LTVDRIARAVGDAAADRDASAVAVVLIAISPSAYAHLVGVVVGKSAGYWAGAGLSRVLTNASVSVKRAAK